MLVLPKERYFKGGKRFVDASVIVHVLFKLRRAYIDVIFIE